MPLKILIDSVFSIKGQGTVLAGTITDGSIHLAQRISVRAPSQSVDARVRGVEVDRQSVTEAAAGEEVGLLFGKNFDLDALSSGFERRENGAYQVHSLLVTECSKPWWKFW